VFYEDGMITVIFFRTQLYPQNHLSKVNWNQLQNIWEVY